MAAVGDAAVMNVPKATGILHGCVTKDEMEAVELNKERIDELINAVEPFIYGGTPLMQAMEDAAGLFELPEYKEHYKLLFVFFV